MVYHRMMKVVEPAVLEHREMDLILSLAARTGEWS
jgi:hypothetical protein